MSGQVRMTIAVLIGLLFTGTVLVVSPAQSGNIEERKTNQYESLGGLKEVFVKVRIGMSLGGPTRRLLQSEVERQLKEIPLRLLPEEMFVAEESPSLMIDVPMLKTGAKSSCYFVIAQLFEPVVLKRNSTIGPYGATWIVFQMGNGDLDSIREDIDKIVMRFIRDYNDANPSP